MAIKNPKANDIYLFIFIGLSPFRPLFKLNILPFCRRQSALATGQGQPIKPWTSLIIQILLRNLFIAEAKHPTITMRVKYVRSMGFNAPLVFRVLVNGCELWSHKSCQCRHCFPSFEWFNINRVVSLRKLSEFYWSNCFGSSSKDRGQFLVNYISQLS